MLDDLRPVLSKIKTPPKNFDGVNLKTNPLHIKNTNKNCLFRKDDNEMIATVAGLKAKMLKQGLPLA